MVVVVEESGGCSVTTVWFLPKPIVVWNSNDSLFRDCENAPGANGDLVKFDDDGNTGEL